MKTSLALQRSTVASARDAHCPGCASNVPCLPGTVQGERGGGGGAVVEVRGSAWEGMSVTFWPFFLRVSAPRTAPELSATLQASLSPPFFLPSSSFCPSSSSSFILHSLLPLLFLHLFLLHSISCSSSPASAIHTLQGSKSCLSTRSC